MSIICTESAFTADNSAYVESSTLMAVTSCGASSAGYSALCLTVETGNGKRGCVTSMICIAFSPGDATSAYVRPFIEIVSMLWAECNPKLTVIFKECHLFWQRLFDSNSCCMPYELWLYYEI